MKRRVLSDEGFPEAVSQGPFSIRNDSLSLVLACRSEDLRADNRLRPIASGQNHRLRGPRVSLF